MSWLEIKNLVFLECLVSFYATTMNHFSIGLWHRRKSGLYTTTGDNQLNGWTEKKLQNTSQSQTCTKKKNVMVSVWCCQSDPLQLSGIPAKPLRLRFAQQIDEMRWKLQRLQSVSVNRMGLILLQDNAQLHVAQPALQKLNELGYKVLPHQQYSPNLCQLPLLQASLQLVAGKMLPQPAGGKKCFPGVCQIPKHRFLCYRNKLVSCWQKCVDCNRSYFWLIKLCLSLVIMI